MTASISAPAQQQEEWFEPLAALFRDLRTGEVFFTGGSDDQALIAAVTPGVSDASVVDRLRSVWPGPISLEEWTESYDAQGNYIEEPPPAPAEQTDDVFSQLGFFAAPAKQPEAEVAPAAVDAQDLRARQRLLDRLQAQPDKSVNIIGVGDGVLKPGQQLKVLYANPMRKRNGDTAWAVRLDTAYEDVVWACGSARALLRTRWRFLKEEVDRRLLAGEPVDLTYAVISTDTSAPQAELRLGSSWDGWEPSISC